MATALTERHQKTLRDFRDRYGKDEGDRKFTAATGIRLDDPLVPFRCVLDRILVEEIPVEEQRILTSGGLALERHGSFAKTPKKGKVLAVGDGVPMGGVLMPMPYKVGQVIHCDDHGRNYINLRTGEVGVKAFEKDERRTFLVRVADTSGELL